jgi:hypothetical protein
MQATMFGPYFYSSESFLSVFHLLTCLELYEGVHSLSHFSDPRAKIPAHDLFDLVSDCGFSPTRLTSSLTGLWDLCGAARAAYGVTPIGSWADFITERRD